MRRSTDRPEARDLQRFRQRVRDARSVYLTMPVSTAPTSHRSAYRSQAAEDSMGRFRCGFFVSSAAVEIASNPMYAKNTMAAP